MGKDLRSSKKVCKAAVGCFFMILSILMLVNSLRLCFSGDIWYDELFTVGMAEHSYGELINFTARDVHPPLYYFIVKFCLDLCKLVFPAADSVVVIKAVSVLPYFIMLLCSFTFVRKRFGMFVSGLFMFCILAMPQLSAFTVEMRMYGWAMLFVNATFFYAHEVTCERKNNIKNYVAIILSGLAAAYTQYFACVAVIMVYIYMLIWSVHSFIEEKEENEEKVEKEENEEKAEKKRAWAADRGIDLKSWSLCVIFSIIGYIPWLFALISQISAIKDNYWILPLTWRSIGGCVKFLMKPASGWDKINVAFAVILFFIYAGLMISYAFDIRKKKRVNADEEDNAAQIATFFYTISACFVLCGLVLFGFIASIIIRPVFVYRYMIPAAGCFWFCFALCLDRFTERADRFMEKNTKLRTAVMATACVVCMIILTVGYFDYSAFNGEEEFKAERMQETQEMFAGMGRDDVIIYNFDQLQAVCGYYVNQDNFLWQAEPEQLIIDMFGNKGSIKSTDDIKKFLDDGRTVWFFGSFNSRENIREDWAKDGIDTEELGSFMLERYWFNIYRVSSGNANF